MKALLVMVLAALMMIATTACGDGDDPADTGAAIDTSESSDATPAADDGDQTVETAEPTESTDGQEDPEPEAQQPQTGGGRGSATLTLDNGESYEFSVLCALEPQEAAGSTIEFAAVSYDKPYNLDVTKFGDDSFNGHASITMYDAETYDTLWGAESILGDIDVELNGSTISGTATFVAGGELGGEEVPGTLEVNC